VREIAELPFCNKHNIVTMSTTIVLLGTSYACKTSPLMLNAKLQLTPKKAHRLLQSCPNINHA